MIRLLFCSVFALIFVNVNSQVSMPMSQDGQIEYSAIVHLDSSYTQDGLYLNARKWVAIAFKSAKDVIQMDDQKNGIIIAKGIIPIAGSMTLADGKVEFTLTIQVKDGRYRYSFDNFQHRTYREGYSGGHLENIKPECGNFYMIQSAWNKVKAITDRNINQMVISLNESMKAKSSGGKSQDW